MVIQACTELKVFSTGREFIQVEPLGTMNISKL